MKPSNYFYDGACALLAAQSCPLKVRVAVQVDADMLVGPLCDKLFDATEREITAEYPYPIMPVHWMTR